jgi:23S rRNA pseudouridine1911/1915/1917 synthase
MDGNYSGIVKEIPGKIRLDSYAAEHLNLLSRSQIKSRLLQARINGKEVKLSRLIKAGDMLELSWLSAAPQYLVPECIALDVLYEDDHCAVINKPQGMVVHPGAGNHSGTLANGLLWRRLHRTDNSPLAGTAKNTHVENLRTGIVHRLDKDTSGVMIAAYDDESLAFLSAQFKNRNVHKQYLALVHGTPSETSGSICTRLVRDPRERKRFAAQPVTTQSGPKQKEPGKIALTRYRILKSWGDYSLLLCKPKTGRTHQIRVHLSYLGNPILGDPVYNSGISKTAQSLPLLNGATLMLHAYKLSIVLPKQQEKSVFKAPMPERFKAIIARLNAP